MTQRGAEETPDGVLDTVEDGRDGGGEGVECVCAHLSYILEIKLLLSPVYQYPQGRY